MSTEQTWSGTHIFTAPSLVEARTIDEVQQVVAQGGRVRALGTRHSFNDIADTTGTMVTVTGIEPDFALDETARTVTVGAGTRYGVLAAWLDEHGWALHNTGSLPHISIAGANATGTHGSGIGNGVLATAIRAIDYVGADGERHVVRRGEPDFAGMAVGLGAYGIAVRITLAIEPTYQVRQDVYRGVPWSALLDDLDAVLGAAYSVSVFTTWAEESLQQVWLKSRMDQATPPERLFGAPSVAASAIIEGATEDSQTPIGGVPGPWSQRLPHFRLDSVPSAGDEIQSEYFVSRSDGAAAIRAVREHADEIVPVLLITELRTAAADELWLSPASERDVLAIHFTWKNDADAVRGVLPAVESALAPFTPRPHWGKVNLMDADAHARAYPRIPDAKALFSRLDPDGVFSNAYLERVGLR